MKNARRLARYFFERDARVRPRRLFTSYSGGEKIKEFSEGGKKIADGDVRRENEVTLVIGRSRDFV